MDSDELQQAFRQLASISAWGRVCFDTTEPSDMMDMYRVEIMESDVGDVRLVHVGGNDLVDVIYEALREYDALRIKPSMEEPLLKAIKEHYVKK